MSIVEDISSMRMDEIEDAEKLTLRWVFQAMDDFGFEAYDIFYNSPDKVDGIAEDITREALDRLAGYNVPQRIFGTVDYRKARYIILPDAIVRQALLVDSKAEKGSRNARIQMSQTSLRVRQVRSGNIMDEPGMLGPISVYEGKQFLTTTVLLHFDYADEGTFHKLRKATIACLPNGLLQMRYNPTPQDNIWDAGPNSPARNEAFRTRLSFDKLRRKAAWRIQTIAYDAPNASSYGIWME